MKIVIGGQINKEKIKQKIEEISGDTIELEIKNDLDAAMAMANQEYDYYLGACNTGGGGALAMVLALCGNEKCMTVSMPGNILSEEEIRNAVKSGKIAFGFTAQHIDVVVPIIIDELLRKDK